MIVGYARVSTDGQTLEAQAPHAKGGGSGEDIRREVNAGHGSKGAR